MQRTDRKLAVATPSSSRSPTPDNPVSAVIDQEDSEFAANHTPHPNCPNSLDCLPDTGDRPQHTFSTIVRSAILGSVRQRLTIREIYQAMETKFPYFKSAPPAWKQSVRHHLSLNRLFERQSRPPSDPGSGDYWTVNLSAPPGTKRPRKRGLPPQEVENKAKMKRRLDKGKSKELGPEDEDDKMGITSDIDTPSVMAPPSTKEAWDEQSSFTQFRSMEPPDDTSSMYGHVKEENPPYYDREEQARAQLELFKLFERYQQEIIKLQGEVSSERQKRYRVQDQLESHQSQLHKMQTDFDKLKQRYEMEKKERETLEAAFHSERLYNNLDRFEDDG